MGFDLMEALKTIIGNEARRFATPILAESAASGEGGAVETIIWDGHYYRLVYETPKALYHSFMKTKIGEWIMVPAMTKNDDGDMVIVEKLPFAWPITVKGVLAELAKALRNRDMHTLMLLRAGVGADITIAGLEQLLPKLPAPHSPLDWCVPMPLPPAQVIPEEVGDFPIAKATAPPEKSGLQFGSAADLALLTSRSPEYVRKPKRGPRQTPAAPTLITVEDKAS